MEWHIQVKPCSKFHGFYTGGTFRYIWQRCIPQRVTVVFVAWKCQDIERKRTDGEGRLESVATRTAAVNERKVEIAVNSNSRLGA